MEVMHPKQITFYFLDSPFLVLDTDIYDGLSDDEHLVYLFELFGSPNV